MADENMEVDPASGGECKITHTYTVYISLLQTYLCLMSVDEKQEIAARNRNIKLSFR